MDRSYPDEMARLAATYSAWRAWHDPADRTVSDQLGGPAVFVASGGSLAVAHLGAALHQARYGTIATVLTPVEFAATPVQAATIFVVSDSMSHPDARLAVKVSRRSGAGATVLLSNLSPDKLGALAGEAFAVSCPRPGRDGYVATNSVLSLSLGLLSIYQERAGAPDFAHLAGPWLTSDGLLNPRHDAARSQVLCLYPPGLRNAAVDLETRVMESGLGTVVATDLRNVGHGRHVGLYRKADATSVVILSDDRWTPLVEATVAALPDAAEVRVWAASHQWPWSALELLLPSAGYLATRAHRSGTDPGNPTVWPGGAKLFRLPIEDLLPALAGPAT